MSNEAITWAYTQKHELMKAGAKFVLVAMADLADQEHSCYPGVDKLAEMTAESRSTVLAGVKLLIELGLISKERRTRKNGSRTSNRYYLAVEGSFIQGVDSGLSDGSQGLDSVPPNVQNPTGPMSEICTPINPQLNHQLDPSDTSADVVVADLFDEFWGWYPRKTAKAAARKAWAKAVTKIPAIDLCAAAAAYRGAPGLPEPQFIPHAATWLNGERWNDPLPAAPASKLSAFEQNVARMRARQGVRDDIGGDVAALGGR